jgi:hypothetical protein
VILRNPFSKRRNSERENDLKTLNDALLGRAKAVVKLSEESAEPSPEGGRQ